MVRGKQTRIRMKHCKHKHVEARIWSRSQQAWWPASGYAPDALICRDCGEWLGLGEAGEPVAVQIEMRAAELSLQTAGTFVTADAQSGWTCAKEDYDPPPWPYCFDAWAGWLAHEIHTHSEPQ